MGNGIAHTFAQHGFKTVLVDLSEDALVKALHTIRQNLDRMVSKGTITQEVKQSTLENISTSTQMQTVVAEASLVVEAATENPEIKFSLFKHLDECTPPGCILASNTSSISITALAAVTKRPDSVIGMHFMNPVPVMKLVEVIRGYSTADQVAEKIVELSRLLNKIPCVVNDYPGFVANRILIPMINEAICTLQEGVAGVEEIDTVMKLGMAHPMGPLQLADFIGLDVCLAILQVLHSGLGQPKYAPNPLLVNMVKAGMLGKKSGEGFYQYRMNLPGLIVSERFKRSGS
jgi:3-hydroxybutyryl-CoA dehydrogenase